MRATLWTLLCALMLQMLAGSAWAMHAPQADAALTHCHDTLAATSVHMDRGSEEDAQAVPTHHNSHSCCAVGIGTGLTAATPPLPQSTPASTQPKWASLSIRPDLRPPI